MDDIDLTPMNEAAARALFAEELSDRYIRSMPPLSPEQKAERRIQFRESFLSDWDAGIIDGDTVLHYRELALAATLKNWRSVAEQAWDNAASHAVNVNLISTLTATALKDENPYRTEAGQ